MGTKKDLMTTEMSAGSKMVWVYIGGVESQNTEENVVKYIKKYTNSEKDISCEKLDTKGKNKSFKVGVD